MEIRRLARSRRSELLRVLSRTSIQRFEKILHPTLPVPEHISEERLYTFLLSCRLRDAPRAEMEGYCNDSFRRFVYTLGLVPDGDGTLLELGANPYFTTILLKKFRKYDLWLSNYFGHTGRTGTQEVIYEDFDGSERLERFVYDEFNIEEDRFPYPDATFEVVLFCEIVEHLLKDPVAALREIQRVLKPDGLLILTTPNVARLENVARLLSGANLYDPYSGYGPYGRHNREYNRHELTQLLEYCGFGAEEMFTADVHPNAAGDYFKLESLISLVSFRSNDLGQYLFSRSRNLGPGQRKRPGWLYRSYPTEELE